MGETCCSGGILKVGIEGEAEGNQEAEVVEVTGVEELGKSSG